MAAVNTLTYLAARQKALRWSDRKWSHETHISQPHWSDVKLHPEDVRIPAWLCGAINRFPDEATIIAQLLVRDCLAAGNSDTSDESESGAA